MTYLKKLFEQFFYLFILILLEIAIAYFVKDSGRFDEFMTVSCLLDIFVFIGSFMVAHSYSKGIKKYKKKFGVNSYTPLFYCVPQGEGNRQVFHAAGLFATNALIICKVSNDISHNLVDDFWDSIEEDVLTIPFSLIKEVGVDKANHENYEDKKRKAYIKDLIRNQTIGRFMRNNQKTVVFAAFIYIVYLDRNRQENIIVFGIGENTSNPGLSVLVEPALPGWIHNTITVTETATELIDAGDEQEDLKASLKTVALENRNKCLTLNRENHEKVKVQ